MKRWLILAGAAAFLWWSPGAWASVGIQDSTGTVKCQATDLRSSALAANCSDGSTAQFIQEARIVLEIGGGGVIDSTTSVALPITNLSSPKLAIKTLTKQSYVEWDSNITSPWQKKFRVPSNYSSGGTFRVLIGRSGLTGTAPAIDFQVFIDRDGTAFDTAATNQTAVSVSSAVGNGSPEQKTLTVATDFATLAAGDYVTLELFRGTGGTEKLELYYVEFVYQALQ